MFFGNKKKLRSLGVDIGTKVIKVVEISKKGNKFILENYGEVNLDFACREFFRSFDKNTLNPHIDNISLALKELIDETKIKDRGTSFSLPDFSTFFSIFEMPPMTKKEIDSAIGFEARKYIPIPLSEVVLDWQSMENAISEKNINKVLVMAVPRVIIEQYKDISRQAGLELLSLEPEAMSLKRAIAKDKNSETICLVEIGFQSTNVSIIEKGFMKTSSSFDLAGKDLTNAISEDLGIGTIEAEKIKRKYGLLENDKVNLEEILKPTLYSISSKIKKVIKEFENKENSTVKKVVFLGGTSLMLGILEYFNNSLNQDEENVLEIDLGRPFEKIIYPQELEERMKELNANYAIALGQALSKFE